MAFLTAPASLVFDRLFFQVLEGLNNGGLHVARLGYAYQRAISRADGDFGLVAMLLDGENHLGIELIAQNFSDFGQAGFN